MNGCLRSHWIAGVLLSSTSLGSAAQVPALDAPPALPSDSSAYGSSGVSFGILLQVRADFPDEGATPSSFFLRKAEVGIRARVGPRTHLLVEIDPVRPSDPLRRTYLRLSHIERLHVKLGMEKAPIGLDELLSSARVPFVDRSEVSDRFSAAEEVGVHLESRWDEWLVQFSLTNGGRRLIRDDNDHKDVSGRVVWEPIPVLSVGVAALSGRAGPGALERRRYNAELRVGSSDRGIQSEYFDAEDDALSSKAYYVSAFYDLGIEHFGLFRLQPAIRYERHDRDDDLLDEELNLLTFGASFLLDGHRSKLQINYLWDVRTGRSADVIRALYQVEF